MIVVDGSQGEGGGQILRSCLSLSMLSGRPLRMERIRARRSRPGLQPQHLTAVLSAQKICKARVRGAEVGSRALEFEPGEVEAGDYYLSIGTAGSTTLVMQTLLPPLLHAKSRSRLTLEGGTHNPLAPPWDFLAESFLPLLRRMGARVEARLERYGFYPAGGGRITAEIDPCPRLGRLELPAAGAERRASGRILLANLPEHIGRRERKTAAEIAGIPEEQVLTEEVPSAGPGNAVMLKLDEGEVANIITAFGEKGVSAESVAAEAAYLFRRHAELRVPVGEHLADQLLLPLALGEGSLFLTGPLSGHTVTQIELLERFLEVKIRQEPAARGNVLLRVDPA